MQKLFGIKNYPFWNNPVFVVGMGRSGTTVLCRALEQHPSVLASRIESILVHQLGNILYNYISRETHPSNILLEEEAFKKHIMELCLKATFGEQYGLSYHILNQSNTSIISCKNKIKVWLAKVFPDKNSADGLNWLYPNSKYIYIHRNGIDVVYSMGNFRSFKSLSFKEHCELWNKGALQYHYLTEDDKAIVVKHQDMVENSAAVLNKIISFLKLEPNEGAAEYAASTLVRPLDKTVELAVDAKTTFQNREPAHQKWSNQQKETFKNHCSESMEMLGYEIPF